MFEKAQYASETLDGRLLNEFLFGKNENIFTVNSFYIDIFNVFYSLSIKD